MTAPPELREIRLLSVPVWLRQKSTQHGEELVREMTLVAHQIERDGGSSLPSRLVHLAEEVKVNYGALSASAEEQVEAAIQRGEDTIEALVYLVPTTMEPFLKHLADILEEADEFCRQGRHLLTLATPPDVAAYRQWVIQEFHRQLHGEPPIPWPDFTPPGSGDEG